VTDLTDKARRDFPIFYNGMVGSCRPFLAC
jgi:hypothetical protein